VRLVDGVGDEIAEVVASSRSNKFGDDFSLSFEDG